MRAIQESMGHPTPRRLNLRTLGVRLEQRRPFVDCAFNSDSEGDSTESTPSNSPAAHRMTAAQPRIDPELGHRGIGRDRTRED
jgi:hypothetical protein